MSVVSRFTLSTLDHCNRKSGTQNYMIYIFQVVNVHQNTVDSYLESIVLDSVDNTADAQARFEISELAMKINDVAYDMEDK